jgi:SAM-dependent methyltransferase
MPPDSIKQDSSKPDFWDTRYRGAVTPWDQGKVQSQLLAFADARADRPRTLIPGCGSAYEALALARRGWDVLAIDFSDAAIDAALAIVGARRDLVRKADFFAFEGDTPPFDVVIERAFLCALPPRLWPDYAARMAALVRPGGVLAGYFFLTPTDRGPPFGTEQSTLDRLLAPAFDLTEDRAVTDSLAIFAGKERWQVWTRKRV